MTPTHHNPTRRRGQVLVIMILALVLLAGLIFYVYNVGHQVNNRLSMQQAADATAISGATWLARTMNVVAMDNVGAAKMIALVPVLDSLPLAAEMTRDELPLLREQLVAQSRMLRANSLSAAERQILLVGVETLVSRMQVDETVLPAFCARFSDSAFDMPAVTHWNVPGASGSPPQGKLWQAAVALDQFSQASVDSMSELAQSDAARFGKANGAQTAFMVPVLPGVPSRRTDFGDFEPVLRGRLIVNASGDVTTSDSGGMGGAIPDGQSGDLQSVGHRLGPWARLHRWVESTRDSIPNGSEYAQGLPGAGMGGSSRATRQYGATIRRVAWGPYEMAIRTLRDQSAEGSNRHIGRLEQHVRRIAGIKLDYMFQTAPAAIVQTNYPRWITDYDHAKVVQSEAGVSVFETQMYMVDLRSSVAEDATGWLSAGTFQSNRDNPMEVSVRSTRYRTWYDPSVEMPRMVVRINAAYNRRLRAIQTQYADDPARLATELRKLGGPPNPKSEHVMPHVWKLSLTEWVMGDSSLGIAPVDPETDDPVAVHVIQWFIFGGINIGPDVDVRNPCNWTQEEMALRPAPTLLDMPLDAYSNNHDDPVRRNIFSVLGVAQRSDAPGTEVADKFRSANPAKMMAGVAQAEVFNNVSWDLWTQKWQAQLVPVTRWQDWMTRLAADVPQSELPNGELHRDQVQQVYKFLSGISPEMADAFFAH